MMKKLLLITLGMTLVLALYGCKKPDEQAAQEQLEDNVAVEAPMERDPVYVKTAEVTVEEFSSELTLPGKLSAKETVVITAKVSGDITVLKKDLGESVKAGTVLGCIDAEMYALQTEKAKIAMETARLSYENQVKLHANNKALYESGALSKTAYDGSELQTNVSRLQKEMAENDFRLAQKNSNNTVIKSPVQGIVSERSIELGENVGMGSPLFTVVNVNELYAEAGVFESARAILQVGDEVTVISDTTGEEHIGTIAFIGPVPEQDTDLYPVKVLIGNSDQKLMPGMFVTMTVKTGVQESTVAVAKKAVFNDQGKDYVYVVKNDVAVKQEVVIGDSADSQFKVISGLVPGDQVVVTGKEYLEDQVPVIVNN